MTHQIIFISPRDPRVVENWPEEFELVSDWYRRTPDYEIKIKQAIANAIEFKLKKDKEDIIWALWNEDSASCNEAVMDWQPDINKPYDVPTGIEIAFEFNCRLDEMQCSEECHGIRNLMLKCNCCTKFAFIKSSQVVNGPEQESQDSMIDEIITIYSDCMNTYELGDCEKEAFNIIKSKFTISRNKM